MLYTRNVIFFFGGGGKGELLGVFLDVLERMQILT